MKHLCHAEDCKRVIPPQLAFCREHWYALPAKVRAAIWREYREGQEVDKKPSTAYLAVQAYARAKLAFKPNDEAAALAASRPMLLALKYAARCVEAGELDPLRGLT